jgi:polysaccharide export outer membrane protein
MMRFSLIPYVIRYGQYGLLVLGAVLVAVVGQGVLGHSASASVNGQAAHLAYDAQQADAAQAPDSPPEPQPPSASETAIKVGDNLLYRVVEDRDEAIVLTVDETGQILVPYYSEPIQAVGRTPRELARAIQQKLEASLYQKATVLLSWKPSGSTQAVGTVYLAGRVNKIGPMQMDLSKRNTVAKLVLAAGGLADFANGASVQVVRRNPKGEGVEKITVNVKAVLEDGQLDKDLEVLDGDFIIVPKKFINW